MKINNDILNRVFEEAAMIQTEEEYKKLGYEVEREKIFNNLRADLVATKGEKVVVFEFKSGRWKPEKTDATVALRNYVSHDLKGEFKLVIVNPPQEKEIIIDDIENILYQYMFEHMQDVDQIATHISIDEVSDVEIDTINISSDEITITGSGNASYDTQYGSDGDMAHGDGLQSTETFPFTFHIQLNHELEIEEVEKLEIDTSSFYE